MLNSLADTFLKIIKNQLYVLLLLNINKECYAMGLISDERYNVFLKEAHDRVNAMCEFE